jgi:GNAT superfamily N-acetyltransferase
MVAVEMSDKSALAELMLNAYRGTADYEGESLEEAEEEIEALIGGKYGAFLSEHSFARWKEGVMISATLITWHECAPLLAFSMTRADFKRRGHAKALIAATAESLAKAGYKSLDLYVTASNRPAIELYRKMGFQNT